MLCDLNKVHYINDLLVHHPSYIGDIIRVIITMWLFEKKKILLNRKKPQNCNICRVAHLCLIPQPIFKVSSFWLSIYKFKSFIFFVCCREKNRKLFFLYFSCCSSSFDIHTLAPPAPGERIAEWMNREDGGEEEKNFIFRHNFQNRLLFIFNRFILSVPFCSFYTSESYARQCFFLLQHLSFDIPHTKHIRMKEILFHSLSFLCWFEFFFSIQFRAVVHTCLVDADTNH